MLNRARLTRPPRILIASDRDHAVGDVQSSLGRRGYSVLRVSDEHAVLERARTACPDAILLDAGMSDGRSFDLARALSADAAIGSGTPILLLVPERPTRQDHLAALRAGIWELLAPPVNAIELLGRLDHCILAKVETQRAPRRHLVDETTGLYTAHGLERRMEALVFQASQHNTSVACVVLAPDLPGDSSASAATLRDCVRLLQAGGRHSDAIGRVGPNEFAVVAPGASLTGARQLARRLRGSFLGLEGAALEGQVDAGPARELRAGCAAAGRLRTTPVEPHRLLARAARALETAQLEGKWLRADA